jgi:hypothetical protein
MCRSRCCWFGCVLPGVGMEVTKCLKPLDGGRDLVTGADAVSWVSLRPQVLLSLPPRSF